MNPRLYMRMKAMMNADELALRVAANTVARFLNGNNSSVSAWTGAWVLRSIRFHKMKRRQS